MERVSSMMTSYRKSRVAGVILEKTRLWPVQLFLRAVAVGLWWSLQDDSPDCWKQDLLKISGAVSMTAAAHTLKAEHRAIN